MRYTVRLLSSAGTALDYTVRARSENAAIASATKRAVEIHGGRWYPCYCLEA